MYCACLLIIFTNSIKVHQGETGAAVAANAWLIEPHIRHNNTIQTQGSNLRKTINIPFECEWPTTSMGADPLGFRINDDAYNFQTESNIILKVKR